VDVPWLPYTLLSFCLVLIHGHPKLLTLILCPHSDSPFGCSAILLYVYYEDSKELNGKDLLLAWDALSRSEESVPGRLSYFYN